MRRHTVVLRRENVIVTLQLVDAAWATSVAQGSRQ
jgi:hypothetical protein